MTPAVPALRLSSFYFMYYAVLGGFTPYWSLYLKDRGQDAAAIGLLMSLWYATRIVAPSSWNWLAGRSSRPIRWLHLGCLASVASFCVFLLPLDFAGLDRKSTRLNSSHLVISYAVFCLKKKKK